MPRPPAEEPLRKVTLNLFEEDCQHLARVYGYGWSEQVRQWVREKVRKEGTVHDE